MEYNKSHRYPKIIADGGALNIYTFAERDRAEIMIKAGIIGSTGYAGAELVRLLSQRDDVEIVWYGSRSYVGEEFSSIYKNTLSVSDVPCADDDLEKLAEVADVIFTATPQGFLASKLTEDILARAKVIDLSADFRIKDVATYEKWYGIEHQAVEFLDEAVYGLPEINREAIKTARLVANPGCYPTCSFLSTQVLVREGIIDPSTLIIDAKSGTSGAGRGAKTPNLYCEVNESIKAYGVTTHRHTPEIEDQLSRVCGKPVMINFTPHLVPMDRGILVTAYANLAKSITEAEIAELYDKYYADEYFVRVLKPGEAPETRWVKGSNFVDVSFKVDERTNRIVMMGAIDNLVKGAAGQAVQNMNLMFGPAENAGLKLVPMFP